MAPKYNLQPTHLYSIYITSVNDSEKRKPPKLFTEVCDHQKVRWFSDRRCRFFIGIWSNNPFFGGSRFSWDFLGLSYPKIQAHIWYILVGCFFENLWHILMCKKNEMYTSDAKKHFHSLGVRSLIWLWITLLVFSFRIIEGPTVVHCFAMILGRRIIWWKKSCTIW